MSFTEVAPTEVERPLTEKKGHRWLPYLTLVLLVETCLTVHFLRYDPGFMNWLADRKAQRASTHRAEQLQVLMRNDPRIGQRIQQNPAVRLPGMNERTPMLAVFIGTCSSCMAKDLRQWESVKTDSELNVMMVVRDSPQQVKAFWKEHGLTLPFTTDPQGNLHKVYNAIYVPRAYGIDAEGRLVWIQKNDALSPGEIVRAASVGEKTS